MSRRAQWLRLGITGLALVGVLAAVVMVTVYPPWEKPSEQQIAHALVPRAVALAPGIYLLGRTEPAASYVVDTGQGLVLIDSGLESGAETVTRQLAQLKLDVNQVRMILLTHVHADHSLGAARLRELAAAKVYAGQGDSPPLRAGQPREAFFSTFFMPDVPMHPTTVDVPLAGGEAIDIGNAHISAIAAPGHTPGSICYLLERDGQRVLFTGDVVQSLDPATEGVLGTYAAYLPPVYRGDAKDYLDTLRRLKALPPLDMVLPGHPRMDAQPQNPHLPPERWLPLLDKGIREMEQLLERRKADGANFLDGNPKQLLPGLHYLGDLAGRAVYVLESPKGLFLFDAPGGAKLGEFLAKHFKSLGWSGKKLVAVLLTSADEPATAGLADLVRDLKCKVVAPKAGLDEVRRQCPKGTQMLSEENLAKAGWFDVEMLPLKGLGKAPAAYVIRCAGKTVVISGRMPTKLTDERDPAMQQLFRELEYVPFFKSLEELKPIHPDLWLPAIPVHGQTANLYDRDWDKVIERLEFLLR
jgi:glyoxylase-like metal-dependent hydrolase (beta-lactamase superfamily II)